MSGRVPTEQQWKELISKFSPSKTFYGTCVTDGNVANKVVECPEFGFEDLLIGTHICITMANDQTYDGQVKLNINDTGAQNFYIKQDDTNGLNAWEAGQTVDCVFDGLAWCLVGVSGGMSEEDKQKIADLEDKVDGIVVPKVPALVLGSEPSQRVISIRPDASNPSRMEVYASEMRTADGATFSEFQGFIPAATATSAGVMPAPDKAKLDNLPAIKGLGEGMHLDEEGNLVATDMTEISQETGDSETAVMSQKAVSQALESLSNDLEDYGTAIAGKQDELVSGTTIKTINSTSLLGSGNMELQPLLISGTTLKTVNNNSLLGSGNVNIPIISVLQDSGESTTAVMSQKATSDLIADAVSKAVAAQSEAASAREVADSAQTIADEVRELAESLQTGKQDTLVSGTSIKTINSTSLLGSGNMELQPLLVSGTTIKTVNNNSLMGSGNINIPVVTVADEGGQSAVNAISQKYVTNQLSALNTSVGTANTNASNAQATADEAKELAESLQTGKQDTLISGTSIKTINSTSLLGSGNMELQPLLVSGTNLKTVNNNSLLGSGNINIPVVEVLDNMGNSTTAAPSQKAVNVEVNRLSNAIDVAQGTIDSVQSLAEGKQDALVSGTTIKTINSTSLLGSGNMELQPLLVSGTNIKTVNNNSILGNGNINIPVPTVSQDTGESTTAVMSQKATSDAISAVSTVASGKQDALVSGTTIKTINSTSLLGSGNIEVQTPLVSGTSIKTINNTSLLGSGNISISSGPTVVQATGTSTTSVMSQKAVSDQITALNTTIGTINNILTRLNTGTGV